MGGPPRRLVSLIGGALLLAVVLLTLHNVYYNSPARAWPDAFLRPNVGVYDPDPGRGQLVLSEEQLREDRNGLRTILFPEHHIHREASTVRLRWNVTTAELAPDGVRKQVYLINGQFPGPTIEVRSGDELEIEVTNSAGNDEGISIHWHGLSIKGANEMDGVIGLTQCEISKGQTFVYKFRIQETESGTFWYHAHSSVHLADGLYGGIVVHRPVGASGSHKRMQQDYDAEQLLLIGDWYHRKAQSVLDWYEDTQHFGFEPAPDSILINGRGHFNCSMAVKAFPVECGVVDRPQLKLYGTRTRLRIINTGALAGFNIAIPGAKLDLIEIDGGNSVIDTTPSESLGVLYPGERMDIIAHRQPHGTPENAFIVALDKENLKFKNFALTPTQTFSLTWDTATDSTVPDHHGEESSVAIHFNLADAHGSVPSDMPLAAADAAVFYTRLEILAFHENAPLGVVNHSSWFVEDANAAPLLGKDRHEWAATITPPSVFGDLEMQRDVPWYRDAGSDRWMDIVLNNLDEKGHPFHLHGHQFYVVSSHTSAGGQYGAYNPFGSNSQPGGKFNLDSPLRKDTVYVPRMGYVVLRVRMDNEGLWMLHCHSLWHHGAGMGIALQIGEPASMHVRNKAKELCRA